MQSLPSPLRLYPCEQKSSYSIAMSFSVDHKLRKLGCRTQDLKGKMWRERCSCLPVFYLLHPFSTFLPLTMSKNAVNAPPIVHRRSSAVLVGSLAKWQIPWYNSTSSSTSPALQWQISIPINAPLLHKLTSCGCLHVQNSSLLQFASYCLIKLFTIQSYTAQQHFHHGHWRELLEQS